MARYTIDVDLVIKNSITVELSANSYDQAVDLFYETFRADELDTYELFNDADVETEVTMIEEQRKYL